MTDPVEAVTVEQLKPCPFCGERCADLVINQGTKWAHYEPSCLEVRTGYDLSDSAAWRTEAIAAWNTRTQANEAMREALTKAADALDRIHRQPIDPDMDVLGKGDADALGIVRDIARRASKRARRALSGDSA